MATHLASDALAGLPGTPIAMPRRERHSRESRPLRRVPGARFGRRTYRVCVTLRMPDGQMVIGYPLGPEPQTRFQARKLLVRVRRDVPEAYVLRGQEVL